MTTPQATSLDPDLELLRLQSEHLFDDSGRLSGFRGVTIAQTYGALALWIGAEVPDELASELAAGIERTPSTDVAVAPPALERCRRLLERGGQPVHVKSGPTYIFPDPVQFPSPSPIARSDAADPQALRGANPGNWHPVEWDELLDGHLGPWTMIVDKGVAVSICHTPVPLTARAVECGVWTHTAFRGRGYASAVTSEWAALTRAPGRHLFYGTDSENLASQAVARRLGLRLVGWTWRLWIASGGAAGGHLHPLCSLRRR